ncbi:MAG: TPM domain-containing protein [Gammaproteobacteria bacterium]|nr:TPM domain-containing protein [Gammaproteobacteria bacterium]
MSNVSRYGVALLLLWLSLPALAAVTFPSLTGRVVDQAGLLDSDTAALLEQQLEAHETATGNQVVVVTLKDLQGLAIEDYGYQLGRAWGIGQKGKDNGVLLIVVPGLRKVRIEVGYGLEGVLTDALSSNIIQMVILPAFRNGNFNQGIVEGTEAVIQVLGGQYRFRSPPSDNEELPPWWVIFFIPLIFLRRFGYGGFYGHHGGHYSGSRRGGGFGGGGGGFGGGGASGGW